MSKSVGIVGAGQLGKMLAEAMLEMEIDFVLYDSQSDACGRSLGKLIHRPFDDLEGIDELIQQTDIITCEFENVPTSVLQHIENTSQLLPPAQAFAIASHRLKEKSMFARLGIPCVSNQAVDSFADIQKAIRKLGMPLVLKTCSGGYDGKGQVVITEDDDLAAVYEPFANLSCIAEQWIDFTEEVSCIIVRCANGSMLSYPLTRNYHKQGILRISMPQSEHPFEQQAVDYCQGIADDLDYVGVLALECFVTSDGQLLANEIAPRVHNSGHWTIEGATTSQFENHIRAVLDRPLGATSMLAPSAMINLLGCIPTVASDEQTFVHAYGKQIKPKRKVGHITLLADSEQALLERVGAVYQQIYATNVDVKNSLQRS